MHPIVQEYLNRVVIRDGQKWIDSDVYLYGLGLTELNFHDINVNGSFFCLKNNLTTLEGSPKIVNGHFNCRYNKLTTLKGLGGVDGRIFLDKPLKCDYYLQYVLMDKIRIY